MLADDEEEATTTDGECACQFCEVQAGDIEVKDMIPSSLRSAKRHSSQSSDGKPPALFAKCFVY